MTEQLTAEAVALLGAALLAFWCAIAVAVRRHRRRGAGQRSAETTG